MPKRLGGIIGCEEYKNDGSNIGSTEQYNTGEKPTVMLYTYINGHTGTPDMKQNENIVKHNNKGVTPRRWSVSKVLGGDRRTTHGIRDGFQSPKTFGEVGKGGSGNRVSSEGLSSSCSPPVRSIDSSGWV